MRARDLLLYAWELPQSSLGLALFGVQAARGRVKRMRIEEGRVFAEVSGAIAISLGHFVFYSQEDNAYVPVGPENRDHEYGHALQSRLLGPFYLPVVGVTSELRVVYAIAYKHLRGRRWAHYYDGFPEDWADRLGGVDKSLRPAP